MNRFCCNLNEDGSYQLTDDNMILLENAYPGINTQPLRCVIADVSAESVHYRASAGSIELHLTDTGRQTIAISTTIECGALPFHTFWPFYEAKLPDASGVYQVAGGMMGDTGYVPFDHLSENALVVSHGMVTVRYPHCCLTFYAVDHSSYGMIYELRVKNGQIFLSAGIQLENTAIPSDGLPCIKVLYSAGIEEGLNQAAHEIGSFMNARLQMPPAYHWCSWYYCYENFDIHQLREYLDEFSKMEFSQDIQYFQIDAGYVPSLGDWLLTNHRWPNGIKEGIDAITAHGFVPGIWIGPYMVGNRSILFKEHPDWILYDLSGKPVIENVTDNEPKQWGYQDEEYYVLDTSHPDAMDYLRNVFRTFRGYGIKMFKTDFMLWGFHDSTKVKRHTPGKTSVEYLRDLLSMIRSEIGEESYLLGCIAPFLPFVGYADGMRIGGDIGSTWDGEYGPQNMLTCLAGNNFANQNFYQIDPDAVMLRDFQIRLTETEIYSLALLAALSGGCIYTSDPLHKITDQKRINLFQFIKPDKRRKCLLPFIEDCREHIVLTHINKENGKGMIYIFNKTNRRYIDHYRLSDLGFDSSWSIQDFETNAPVFSADGIITADAVPHGFQLLILNKNTKFEIDYRSLWHNLD